MCYATAGEVIWDVGKADGTVQGSQNTIQAMCRPLIQLVAVSYYTQSHPIPVQLIIEIHQKFIVGRAVFPAHRTPIPNPNLLKQLNLGISSPRKRILPLIPDPQQLFLIPRMDLIYVGLIWRVGLHDLDGFAGDDVDRTPVGHQADVVVEDACNGS